MMDISTAFVWLVIVGGILLALVAMTKYRKRSIDVAEWVIVAGALLWYLGFVLAGGYLGGLLGWNLTQSFVAVVAGVVLGVILGLAAGFVVLILIGALIDFFWLRL